MLNAQRQNLEQQTRRRDEGSDSDSSSLSSSDDRKRKKRKSRKPPPSNGQARTGRMPPKPKRRDLARAKSTDHTNFTVFLADSYIALSALLLQIFVYYFQAYSEILSNAGSRAYLAPITALFNMDFEGVSSTDSSSGFCGIPFVTALSEIFITLIFPGFLFFSLMLIYSFCHRGFSCGGCSCRLSWWNWWMCSDCCKCGTIQCGKKRVWVKPYVQVAYHRILIIVLGIGIRVLVMCITCKNLDEDSDVLVAFFYTAKCFDTAWFMAVVIVLLLVVYFMQIYLKLYQMTEDERYSADSPYSKLVQAYKHQYWYWEAVITSRRFVITLFVKLQFVGGGYSNLVLVLILIFYMLAQLTLCPFKHTRNNRIEAFCILSVLIGFVAVNFEDIANSTVCVICFIDMVCKVLQTRRASCKMLYFTRSLS